MRRPASRPAARGSMVALAGRPLSLYICKRKVINWPAHGGRGRGARVRGRTLLPLVYLIISPYFSALTVDVERRGGPRPAAGGARGYKTLVPCLCACPRGSNGRNRYAKALSRTCACVWFTRIVLGVSFTTLYDSRRVAQFRNAGPLTPRSTHSLCTAMMTRPSLIVSYLSLAKSGIASVS